MRKVALCHISCCAAFVVMAGLVQAVEVRGQIDAVTLYRGQALVARRVSFQAPAGPVELVVTGLPERTQGDSLYASAGRGLQIRSVQYRTRAVRQAPRQEIRELDERLERLSAAMRQNQSEQRTLEVQARYVAGLQQFVAPTAKTELTERVLDVDVLTKLTGFVFAQTEKLDEAEFELAEARRGLEGELNVLRSRRAKLTAAPMHTEREAVVRIEKEQAGAAEVRLVYVVDGANWSPAYNLRASGDRKTVALEYNAVIEQVTGEDWGPVELTLSTALPRMASDPPILTPLLVTLAPRGGAPSKPPRWKESFTSSQKKLQDFEQQRQRQTRRHEQIDTQWLLNSASSMTQVSELSASAEDVQVIQKMLGRQGSGLSANYRLDGRVSVSSRSDRQIVRIAALSLPAAFSNVAAPLLTELVYRQAKITNDSKIALLEGQSSVYLDGEFVGRGMIPMAATGQRFRVGFGTDPQLRAWREFVSREEALQGGNRVVTYKYRLVLDNYKDTAATVAAFDRVPCPQDGLRVDLGETEATLCQDAEYQRAFRPLGILRWDTKVPAGSAAQTAHIVEYSFRLECDKDMAITTVSSEEQQEEAMEFLKDASAAE